MAGWFINGELFAGAIVTVGSGKDYESLQDAVNAMTEDTLILAYLADNFLVDTNMYVNNYKKYIKGIGELSGINLGRIFSSYSFGDIYENVSLSAVRNACGIFNRCSIDANNHTDLVYPIEHVEVGLSLKNTSIICIENMYPMGFGYHIVTINRSLSSLDKVSYNNIPSLPGWRESNVWGSYIVDDKAAIGTEGYGPDYGVDLIQFAGNSRYWIGGSGNWNDSSHWSYESGGSGGANIPDETNDVFFDENSFTKDTDFIIFDEE
jgi:hypothetical protein